MTYSRGEYTARRIDPEQKTWADGSADEKITSFYTDLIREAAAVVIG